MKIGVTGSDHICDRIQKTLEKRMPDLEVVYRVPTITGTVWKRLPSFRKGKYPALFLLGRPTITML